MTNAGELPAEVRFLLDPAVYPHPVAEVELVQTHISYVLLAGDFVYKMKKPVDFGFLDFTELDRRRYYCAEELRLNRRLCPEIYLAVVSLNRAAAGGLALEGSEDGPGEPVEYLVKMARLPQEGMMPRIIDRGELTPEHLHLIVHKLVPFYRRADDSPEVRELGGVAAVRFNVEENFQQTVDFVGTPALSRERFARIREGSLAFLDRPELFAARQEAGRVREGHGDLHAANICFAGDQVHIFDCIEFNRRFRCADVAEDIAFLAMDLDFRDLGELSRHFVEYYAHLANDPEVLTMLPFYCCYRAYVRGKINLFTAAEPEVDDTTRQQAQQQAARYFALAQCYADELC
ncbi:hypothetical protein [Desulfurivibrio alkaliphilus]|uniref:hypothetical protein n=1 Tax=Desulfurivibrio alkaliphilus TaxID=427923 RepID=UPI0001B3E11D|nr:hypothetical protein [Desulfurivibrio alkaliphilus]